MLAPARSESRGVVSPSYGCQEDAVKDASVVVDRVPEPGCNVVEKVGPSKPDNDLAAEPGSDAWDHTRSNLNMNEQGPTVPAETNPCGRRPQTERIPVPRRREFKDALRKMFQPDKPKRKRKS